MVKLTLTIVSDFGYIANPMVIIRKEIVVIRWKRWKTFTKAKAFICGLAIER